MGGNVAGMGNCMNVFREKTWMRGTRWKTYM